MSENASAPPGSSGGGDPLGAMYFLAALLMGVAFLVIVVLTFLPRDFFSRSDQDDLIIPAARTSVDSLPPDSLTAAEAAAAAREAEEMHMH